jgi:citrate lyase subunit beta/citryl-CoA lyase
MSLSIEDLGPSLLFCPGDRPERYRKAVDGADTAVLDLEDGTAEANRDLARAAIVDYLKQTAAKVIVRINLPGTARGKADAAAVIEAGCRMLILPKSESVEEIDAIARLGDVRLLATTETARGVQALPDILAHPAVVGVGWGPYDLSADMGMRRVRDAENRLLPPLLLARDTILLHAAAAKKAAIDTVTAEIKNLDLLKAEAEYAADVGYVAKFSIHPSQIPIIRAAFRPADAEIDRAKRMLAAAGGRGAFAFEGEMIDEPILRRARRVLALAERADRRG